VFHGKGVQIMCSGHVALDVDAKWMRLFISDVDPKDLINIWRSVEALLDVWTSIGVVK
jgi:hypothetical protein